ncbi:hypothetical protein B7P43_G03007, partial [Cryptotermes secundus]
NFLVEHRGTNLAVLAYASETWPLSRSDERLLSILERRILRYIFGPVEENGIWRKRYNHELYKLFNEPDIIGFRRWIKAKNLIYQCIFGFIKVKMLEYAGHIIRASENTTIKKMLNTKPEGNRRGGRPRLRWEECVWQDVRILGVKNWWNVASNEEEWRAILRKARAHKGLSCQ